VRAETQNGKLPQMAERKWEIGISGTFDVANYGDLLFPLIAEAELGERLGSVNVHRFSYNGRIQTEWPFQVTSVTELPRMIQGLDGMLIGGGFLIRFDQDVAPGYVPPAPYIHHPTGFWLTPALMALQHNVPLAWNSPGTDGKSIPDWAKPLMEMVLSGSRYVSVRDESSRAALETVTNEAVSLVPDTGFGVPRLLNLGGAPSGEFTRFCEASNLKGPYVIVQAKPGMEGFVAFLKKHSDRWQKFRFLTLPISPALGDQAEIIEAGLPCIVRPAYWPGPLVIAELIGRAEAVVGHSYHLCVTALSSGVPVFARHGLPECKYSVLGNFDGFFTLPPNFDPDIDWFLARVGRTVPSAAARATHEPLCNHWDRITAVFKNGPVQTAQTLNRVWQTLPGLLEDWAAARNQIAENERQLEGALRERASLESALNEMIPQLTQARAERDSRDARIGDVMNSLSWRLTAPLRFAGRYVRKPERQSVMNLTDLRNHRLESFPYAWAAINNLLRAKDLEGLAATYPCDHFKRVNRFDAERNYEYEARSLIGMGEPSIAYREDLSDAWQRLAMELLSPEYRSAMTALTGCDLSQAPLEANVFHYGPGGSMDAHRDLPEKIVTHVLYFNRSWEAGNGGCLQILRSSNPEDILAEIPPLAGYSSIIVRSENSWHAVSRVASGVVVSRRSVTITFYRPGSVSTMWPPEDNTPLHHYRNRQEHGC
jgi:Rps23 Pro-64 3,4-dihydroxylase Tpa1-like proline 4-hydroxylase